VGGEHLRKVRVIERDGGSSPRGRGTPAPRPAPHCPPPVHPRVGGEHFSQMTVSSKMFGSSPRGRGTHVAIWRAAKLKRFIPAWAGNTQFGPGPPPVPAVHPRVGGEHSNIATMRAVTSGSSPRGRGTPQQ